MLGRVLPGGSPVYAFNPRPGSRSFSMLVSPEEYAAVIARGWARMDDQVARPVPDGCDAEMGFLQMRLDEPYRAPSDAYGLEEAA